MYIRNLLPGQFTPIPSNLNMVIRNKTQVAIISVCYTIYNNFMFKNKIKPIFNKGNKYK